jgi:hypothetical protein
MVLMKKQKLDQKEILKELYSKTNNMRWDWSTHVNHGKNSMDPAEYYNETFKS